MGTRGWSAASQLLGLVRAEPGITRATAAQRLGMGSGAATELLARLRNARLVEETPAPSSGRGRPTTVLEPHPAGPLVIAAELRAAGWRLALAGIDGTPTVIGETHHGGASPDDVLRAMGLAIRDSCDAEDGRVQAVSVSVAGTLSDARLVQFTTRRWRDVDLGVLTADLDVPLLLGNDATLAGLAEARSGAARGAGTALHLIVAVGIGGTLIVNDEPVTGAHGAAGEYGHIPFGDPAVVCPCGARGCWDLTSDGRALAQQLGDEPPADPIAYAYQALEKRSAATQHAFESVAASLGTGIGGLVNLHDPDVITLGGLAAPLRKAAPEAFTDAYRDALMGFRKDSAPPIRDGVFGEDGPLYGAAAIGIDRITTEFALAQWAAASESRRPRR